MKGFPCRFCQSTDTTFVKEQFDDRGVKLGELWNCPHCKKKFRVTPEEKFKKGKRT